MEDEYLLMTMYQIHQKLSEEDEVTQNGMKKMNGKKETSDF